jgi:hypothetical protein
MNRNPEIDSWRRFRDAEAAGRDVEADLALRELFFALPRLGPTSGFAGRVMARIARPSIFARREVRFGLAAALVVAALSVALLAPMALPLAGLIGPGSVLSLAIRGVAGLSVRAASGLAIWGSLAGAVQVVGRALLHPSVLALLVLQFALAAAALRGLRALVPSTRSAHHAS